MWGLALMLSLAAFSSPRRPRRLRPVDGLIRSSPDSPPVVGFRGCATRLPCCLLLFAQLLSVLGAANAVAQLPASPKKEMRLGPAREKAVARFNFLGSAS